MQVSCPECNRIIDLIETLPPDEALTCPTCGARVRLADDPVAATLTASTIDMPSRGMPQSLGRFRIRERIGTGSFGTVYLAHDPELDRTVALKAPRAGRLASSEDLDRFLREARSVAQLHHSGIIPVHEVGQQDGVPFLVCDYVRGITLADWLSGRRCTGDEAARVVAALADALEYAHQHGVVHRDVKPSNIMLSWEDAPGTPSTLERCTPYLMDFGLAKRDAAEITMTLEGQVLGTPAYMSPEQAAGEGHQVDGRTDVYSLGVILYQMLTNQLPFQGNLRMLLHQVRNDDPRQPRSLNDRIPRDLETICLKAMSKQPSCRYAAAGDLAADLRRFLAREPITARPIGRWERGRRWVRRHPTASVLLAGAVIAAAALLAGSWWHTSRLQAALTETKRARDEAETRRTEVEQAQAETERQRDDARRNLYAAQLNLAQRAWTDSQITRLMELLEGLKPTRPEDDLRAFEWHYLSRLCRTERRAFAGHEMPVHAVALSPDGRIAASAAGGVFQIFRRERIGDVVGVGLFLTPKEIADPRRLLTPGEVKLWDVQTGQELRRFTGHYGAVFAIAFSPDGKWVASGSEDNTVKVWEVSTGKEIVALRGHGEKTRETFDDPETGKTLLRYLGPTSVRAVAFSPDGKRLASASEDQTVKIWDVSEERKDKPAVPVLTLEGHEDAVQSLAFRPDGKRLATVAADGLVKVWDIGEDRRGKMAASLLTLTGHPLPDKTDVGPRVELAGQGFHLTTDRTVRRVAFSPDGRRLATCADDRTVKVWDAEAGKELFTCVGHTGTVLGVVFSPDGKRLATAGADRTLRLWSGDTGHELEVLRGHKGRVVGLAYNGSGRSLLSGSTDGSVKVYNATTSQAAFVFREHDASVLSVAFSPDGRLAASAGLSGRVYVWDAQTGQALLSLKGHQGLPVTSVTFSPDGRHVASACEVERVLIHDAATGQLVRRIEAMPTRTSIWCTAYSPDGRRLALCGGRMGGANVIKIWDATAWQNATDGGVSSQPLRTLAGHKVQVSAVVFTPDNQFLVSASHDGTAKLWNVETGEEVRTFSGHSDSLRDVALSPDGRTLATASYDRTAKLWDVATGRELRTLRGHTDLLTGVAFNPDGRRLASSAEDGLVKVWDTASGQEVLSLRGHTARVTAVRFRPDGQVLASCSPDGTVRLWEAVTPPAEVLARREAVDLVRGLAERLGLKEEVLGWLRDRTDLEEAVHREGLKLAEQMRESAVQLNGAAWNVVSEPGASASEYRLALRQAEAAVRLAPKSGGILNTLGVAQYRLEQYREAIDTLTRADKLNAVRYKGSIPGDLAFLALAHHRLGEKEKATQYMKKLREQAKSPQWSDDRESQMLLREAESVIKDGP